MYGRPPYGGAQGGGGGGGGFRPPNHPIFSPQTPTFFLPGNPYYQQAPPPPPLPQPHFQNPSFTPFPQNPPFPRPTPSPKPQVTLETIESAVARAHSDLVTAGQTVLTWKVSQAALIALKLDSWNSLGLKIQDVPSLHRLIVTEGKVNAFIHCFVGAQRITSVHELDVAICKSEGIEQFEMLGLGPLLRHPLVEYYFSVPPDLMDIYKVTTEEIISSLRSFLGKRKKRKSLTSPEDFLNFLAEQKSVQVKEKLGVRIQSLGLHISYIYKGKSAEETTLSKPLELVKHNAIKTKGAEGRDPSGPGMLLEKQVLDSRYDSISRRMKSFSSAWDDSVGKVKHVHFDCDDVVDDDEEDEDDLASCEHPSSSHNEDNRHHVSRCPYPSTSEEMARLGLKPETSEKMSSVNVKEMGTRVTKLSGKKRRSEDKTTEGGLCKLPKKEQLGEDNEKLQSVTLDSSSMEKFITIWKEACREHSVSEILGMMMNFYAATKRQKKKIINVFSSYPALGLLNVAVASIKCGMLDSLYDAMQSFGDEPGFVSSGSAPSAEMIEIGPCDKVTSHSNKDINKLVIGVSVDDIIKKIVKYSESNSLMSSEEHLYLGKEIKYLKRLHNCETWLASQFSVNEFISLGHGDFCNFLEQHTSLLPHELLNFPNDKLGGPSSMEVSMLEQQLKVMLSQLESNMVEDGRVTENDFSMVLKKQFPTLTFHISGHEPDKCLSDLIKRHKDSEIDNSDRVMFSTTLLGKRWSGKSVVLSEKQPLEDGGIMPEAGQLVYPSTISSKDAIECLRKAPMLSDLLSWSHWDLIYAPSLGSLLEWLLNEVCSKELLCIATVDGKFIRIEHSTTVDEFLDAFIQRSSFQTAVKLLSLLALYGGERNVPLSLLQCYTQRAIDVIIRNFADSKEVNACEEQLLHKSSLDRQVTLEKGFHGNVFPYEVIKNRNILHKSLSGINEGIAVVSRFILECLGYLPSEFWSFAAEILVSGLRSFSKNAPLVILNECNRVDQRLMLHDIGFSLGISEWIEDYHKFSSSVAMDLYVSPEVLNGTLPSLCSESAEDQRDSTAGSNMNAASQLDVNCHTSSSVHKMEHGDTAENMNHKASDGVCESEVCLDVMSENSEILEDRKMQDANAIVESIRREEFGLDPSFNSAENCLLSKQHARLGRALHCLSQELYSQDSHLLLELVQNADDNTYPESVDPMLVFILQDTGIIVLNNECGFSAQNIRALCDIGNSTKKGSSVGYIGHKGIGFKSVFRVTDVPEIHSNGFHVKFDVTEGQIGFVLPTVVPPCDMDVFRQMLASNGERSDSAPWNTCIMLPFRSNFRDGNGLNSIISMFSDLHPSLLLFLHRLRCIKFKNMLNDNLFVMRRETLDNGIVKVSQGKEAMSWLVVSKKLQVSAIRNDVQTTEIAMAFTLQEAENGEYIPHLSQQPTFAFLPLRNYGLKFIIQGDFVLPSSREEVDGSSAWNQWLLSEFPDLFVSSEQSFCSLPCFQENPGKAVTAYMSFVPLIGEAHGFFSHLPRLIISKLRLSSCLLLDSLDLKWVPPCRVLRGWNQQARNLLSEDLLQKHLGLGYLNKDVILSDSLAKSLGVQDYGPKILVEIISSVCRINNGVNSLGTDWLSSCLSALYSTLLVCSSGYNPAKVGLEYDIIDSLKKVPFIPLSDGSFSSVADGPIWLSSDAFSTGFEGKHSPADFPIIYAKLRTVNPLLFSAGSTQVDNMQESRTDSIVEMLRKIGVQLLSAHDVIKSHICVALSKDSYANKDRNLMIEYFSFIMLHFQYACPSCSSDKALIISELRKRPVLLTDHGFRCPDDEPIHFGKEYGNPIDIDRLVKMSDVKWLLVDVSYLKHLSVQSLSNAWVKWRNFFQDLGVSDFLQVIHVDKNAPDILCNSYGSVTSSRDLIMLSSFISDWESPELDNLLSTLSSKKHRLHCIYLMEILDRMWDENYRAKARSYIIFRNGEDRKANESSFLKSIRETKWVASSMDEELHHPQDLFYDYEEVRSILGTMVPYAIPKVTSKFLLEDIGFKIRVSFEDALNILNSWRVSKVPFTASMVQMSKFYTFISDGVARSEVKIEELISTSFIFTPIFSSSKHNDVVPGTFLSPKEIYWHDPTGCVNRTNEMFLLSTLRKKSNIHPCKELANVYPSLHDFFVRTCGVHYLPPFRSYLQILLQLSTIALPSQVAPEVFKVFLKWADDLKSGIVKSEEVANLKVELLKVENTVLPTSLDRWVSLHPSFGTICWCDDDELRRQFKHSDGVDFLQFGELSNEENEFLAGKVAILFKDIGIPVLSQIVSREAIFYGTENEIQKVSLVNWVLPYAQRYIHKFHPDVYLKLQQLGFKRTIQLKVVVVEKLFYRYTLKGCDSTSKTRIESSCLLQGNVLYTTHSSDNHSVFLELSRFFFDGSIELHLANFLHMVTTMAEASSTWEQMEFFIVNSQKVPKLPDHEAVWSLSSSLESHEAEKPHPSLASPVNIEQSTLAARRKPGIKPIWPPKDWKNAPYLFCSQDNYLETGIGVATYGNSEEDFSKPPEAVACLELPLPIEIDGEWNIEEASTSKNTSVLQDSAIANHHHHEVESFNPVDRQTSYGSKDNGVLVDLVMDHGQEGFDLSTSTEKFHMHALDESQVRTTGRLGEMIAYKYFVDKFGSSNVKWVNKEIETGLPYDMVLGTEEESKEYVEVKSTRYSSKHWFEMSTREWQLATQRGDLFSIAHVILLGPKKATITVLKNPAKLCQQNVLRLAIWMSKQLIEVSTPVTR